MDGSSVPPETFSHKLSSLLPGSSLLSNGALSTPKRRSLSDSEQPLPTLDPSPEFRERPTKSRDDNVLNATPTRTPKRVDLSARGLYLQMPSRDTTFFGNQSPGLGAGLGLHSPHDQREPIASPSSVLPRHSRGMDFSRAATNLHHSTIAEHPSPDSSPTISQKPMLPPSRRNSTFSMALDSPRAGSSWSWNLAGHGDKMSMPRSVGSTNAMTSEASSSSSDDEAMMMEQDGEEADAMISTPQASKLMGGPGVTPYEPKSYSAENTTPNQMQSPSAFGGYRRNILGKRTEKAIRHHPYRQSLRTSSPEPSSFPGRPPSHGSISGDTVMRSPPSRRESLSLGMGDGLHITSSNEDAEDSSLMMSPGGPAVVRRAVTRRSNMLPRTKNFARIRAALQEESSPVDSEFRRESEVVKQVRGNDVGLNNRSGQQPQSPDLTPNVPNLSTELSELSDVEAGGVKGGLASGSLADLRRASRGKDFWQSQQPFKRSSTPPSMLFNRHRSSSGVSAFSEDVSMDSPGITTPPSSVYGIAPPVADPKPSVETGISFQPPNLPTAAEMSRKINNKRRRDDDFDVNSFKRRAVSPGMSVQSSPVLGQSPVSTTGNWPARLSREGSQPNSANVGAEEKERSASIITPSASSGLAGASTGPQQPASHPTPNLGPKRVGLQGMTDTNDNLMSLTLE